MINAILLPTNYFMLHNPSDLDFAYVFFLEEGMYLNEHGKNCITSLILHMQWES